MKQHKTDPKNKMKQYWQEYYRKHKQEYIDRRDVRRGYCLLKYHARCIYPVNNGRFQVTYKGETFGSYKSEQLAHQVLEAVKNSSCPDIQIDTNSNLYLAIDHNLSRQTLLPAIARDLLWKTKDGKTYRTDEMVYRICVQKKIEHSMVSCVIKRLFRAAMHQLQYRSRRCKGTPPACIALQTLTNYGCMLTRNEAYRTLKASLPFARRPRPRPRDQSS